MKNSILVIVISTAALLNAGCKKDTSPKKGNGNTNKLLAESSMAIFSTDFCSLTGSEPALDFGLDRSPSSNKYVFTQSQVNAGIANFHANFKYFSGGVVSELDSSKNSLSISELMELYNVLELDSAVGYNPDSNYSALRITFGMEGKKIVLIYEPIALKPGSSPKVCNVVGTEKYFRVDSNENFMPISSSTFSTLTADLRSTSSKIYITHPNNPGIYSFINASDSTGDIRSNIISFQQITRMYCDNSQDFSSSNRIKFTIVANRNESSTSNYRMHVVAHYGLGASLPASGTFKNYAADYANMCPLNCSVVNVNYYW